MHLQRIAATALALTLSVTVVACGSDATHSMNDSSGNTTAGAAAALNPADVEFSQGMVAHHQQAIEMAEIALDPTTGASPAVVDLATRIKAAQDPEVEMMSGWLEAGGHPMMMDEAGGHSMSSMDGMMTATQMDEMSAMTGADFDTQWLTMMIAHHEGAISQSQTVKSKGSNPDVLELADQIISAQEAEIAEMSALLKG